MQLSLGEDAAAAESRRQSVELFRALVEAHPENGAYKLDWMSAELDAVDVNALTKGSETTESDWEAAQSQLAKVESELRSATGTQRGDLMAIDLGRKQAELAAARNDPATAKKKYAATTTAAVEMIAVRYRDHRVLPTCIDMLRSNAAFLRQQEEYTAALDLLDGVLVQLEKLPRSRPVDEALAVLWQEKMWTYEETGDFEEANAAYEWVRHYRPPRGGPRGGGRRH